MQARHAACLVMQRELEPICCVNCEVRWAPMPRQGMCNACGIYLAQNKRPRPIALAEHLRAKQPWKFITDTPPGHVLIKKDNGRLVAVPIEDAEASPRADDPDNAPPSRLAVTSPCRDILVMFTIV